ncbi:DUF4450 domain-containing protein [Arcticibacter tournemirensis]
MIKKSVSVFIIGLLVSWGSTGMAQQPASQQRGWWHGTEREMHYKPDGADFLLVNGKKRFNRALYGTNTAFRVEAGDLPEFAMYMPGMGGNLKFGLIAGNTNKWLIDATEITTRYRPGEMHYDIKDPILGNGSLHLTVLALSAAEGIVVKVNSTGIAHNVELFAAFGGATGRKFSRDGDIGADPESSFYLNPDYCRGNIYTIKKNGFKLTFGGGKDNGQLAGVFPSGMRLKLSAADKQTSPLGLYLSVQNALPLVCGRLNMKAGKSVYFMVKNAENKKAPSYSKLRDLFNKSEQTRMALVQRVKVNTPDPYINTLGGALAVAADAIWEEPSYLHGAAAWRMRLPAWRGPYVADPLGWHDRARTHFSSYAKSQVVTPERGPVVPDTALHLARQQEKMGTALFSSGYISRNPNDNSKPHHYDMNLVYIDALLNHFKWNGDLKFIKEMWPVINRHLDWEKRNFDADGDGLYDAYAAIWASDALQYSGGGVMHSSAYNYRANRMAAEIAALIGENPVPYKQEADKIIKAINSSLWLPKKAWYAEYKDLLGEKLVHPYAGLWTVYHAIDSKISDPFQAYGATRYVDTEIPHIPVRAKGLEENNLYTLSSSAWQPYTWSVNNVALAELLHTSLAYWQTGRMDDAFRLWKSSLVESMYLSSSPGGFEQLSFYDAQRGELYRDFADPIGVAGRTLVEGLFGILPDALADTLTLRPGFPASWDFASLQVPDISFEFKKSGDKDSYTIVPSFKKAMNLKMLLPARTVAVRSVSINGEKVSWKSSGEVVGTPQLEIAAPKAQRYHVEIEWDGVAPDKPKVRAPVFDAPFNVSFSQASIEKYYDPQRALSGVRIVDGNSLNVDRLAGRDHATIFVKLRQRDFTWWEPISLDIKPEVEFTFLTDQTTAGLRFTVTNNEGIVKRGILRVNQGVRDFSQTLEINKGASAEITVPGAYTLTGTNKIRFEYGRGYSADTTIVNWNARTAGPVWQKVDLQAYFNDKVSSIFKNKYLSPRPSSPTLQLPWQGIGNWCYPLTSAEIDDSGLRRMAFGKGQVQLPVGVPLATPGAALLKNIVFTSKWDNYPDFVSIPLNGRASHAYFMMAGSTNPMQSRFDNGELLIYYTDNTFERLALRNPENWWPIEQDYYVDGAAFTTGAPQPYRVCLKTGTVGRYNTNYGTINGFTNRAIDGGAATVLDLPLNPAKDLKELRLKTLANDVVIGLMSVTLQR